MSIIIKPANADTDFDAIMHISAAAWGSGLDDSVPSHTLRALASNKGTVLMAWEGEKPIGFCYSFLSFEGSSIQNATFYHYSHQAGILPQYLGHQVGEKLKWAQRTAVLAQGVEQIRWTFDPLQTLNANLNMRKLGATCVTYKQNYYGKMDDELNKGLPTDRFHVDWWIGSDWVQRHANKKYQSPDLNQLRQQNGAFINEVAVKNGRLQPQHTITTNWPNILIMTIPNNFRQLHQEDLPLALAWRFHTRELFEQAFGLGYTAVDLLIESDRCHYILQKDLDISN